MKEKKPITEYEEIYGLGDMVNDYEEPGRTIIALDDGRYVEAVECQYTILHIP